MAKEDDLLRSRLAAAQPGDPVRVPIGELHGPFVIDKPLSLVGDGVRSVLLSSDAGPALEITSPGVHLDAMWLVNHAEGATVLKARAKDKVTLGDRMFLTGETSGVATKELAKAKSAGRPSALGGAAPSRAVGEIATYAPIDWDPAGPFADAPVGLVRDALALGGGLPAIMLDDGLDLELGREIRLGLWITAQAGAQLDVPVAFWIDGKLVMEGRQPAEAGKESGTSLRLTPTTPGVHRLDVVCGGLPRLAPAILTRDATYYPRIPPGSGNPPPRS